MGKADLSVALAKACFQAHPRDDRDCVQGGTAVAQPPAVRRLLGKYDSIRGQQQQQQQNVLSLASVQLHYICYMLKFRTTSPRPQFS
jgi:hypothetical protein